MNRYKKMEEDSRTDPRTYAEVSRGVTRSQKEREIAGEENEQSTESREDLRTYAEVARGVTRSQKEREVEAKENFDSIIETMPENVEDFKKS